MAQQNKIESPYTFLALLSAAVTVTLLQNTLGFHWEDTMTLHPAVIYGCISAPPYSAWFNEALLFQIPILAYLSDFFPTVPIVGVWLLVIITLTFTVWNQLALRVLFRSFQSPPLVAISVSLLLVVPTIGLSLEYIHFSRIAILVTSGSLLLSFDYYNSEKRYPLSLFFFFTVGLLIRVHAGILALVFVSLVVLLITRNFKVTINMLKLHWVAGLLCMVIVVSNKYGSGNVALEIEQTYEYVLSDRNAILPLSEMRTSEDSVRYLALTKYFLISDSAQINIPFFQKIIDRQNLSDPLIHSEDLAHIGNSMRPLAKSYGLILFAFYTLLLVLMWRCERRDVINTILINLFGWLVVVILALTISMAERFLIPWVSMLVSTSLWLILRNQKDISLWQIITGLTLLLAIVTLVFQKTIKTSTVEKKYNSDATRYLKNMESISAQYIPVVWDYKFLSFPSEICERSKLSPYKKSIYQTYFFIPYYDFGQKRCLQLTGCSPLDWQCMNLAFNQSKSSYCFVLEDHMALFLKDYYRILYNLDFTLIKEYPPREVMPDNFVFHLNRDSTKQK